MASCQAQRCCLCSVHSQVQRAILQCTVTIWCTTNVVARCQAACCERAERAAAYHSCVHAPAAAVRQSAEHRRPRSRGRAPLMIITTARLVSTGTCQLCRRCVRVHAVHPARVRLYGRQPRVLWHDAALDRPTSERHRPVAGAGMRRSWHVRRQVRECCA